ncbi:MAG: MaoC/PaaZ C-terminal domain-containing protein [Pseudomonadota bacterium]
MAQAIKSLPRLYFDALRTARRSFDRSTRFDRFTLTIAGMASRQRSYGKWCEVIGHRSPAAVLPPWFFVIAQRPLMTALTGPNFPFPVTGMIHLDNRTEVDQPLDWDEPLDIRLEVTHGGVRPSGHVVTLAAEYLQDGARVALNQATALVRCPDPDRPKRRPGSPAGPAPAGIQLEFGAGDGTRYARVSEDWNPIHWSRGFAGIAGFDRPIAHGMFAASRVAALLDAEGLPVRRRFDVEYLRPTLLPSTTVLTRQRGEDGTAFALHAADGDRPLLRGQAA